jgi:hypothetical protein
VVLFLKTSVSPTDAETTSGENAVFPEMPTILTESVPEVVVVGVVELGIAADPPPPPQLHRAKANTTASDDPINTFIRINTLPPEAEHQCKIATMSPCS